MTENAAETIFALASGAWHAGVAVVRVSGRAAGKTLLALSGRADMPPPRRATLAFLHDPETKAMLDQALVLYFNAPHSFTGEDVVEYHLHGGRAVIEGVLNALGRMAGCRLALPGEFTRRAFENGKLDLTEAEAVADLIGAETEAQRILALAQLGGALSALYGGWAESLRRALAHQEADIEFPDEDLPAALADSQRPVVEKLVAEIAAHLDDNHRGERLRSGFRLALIGAPNAGKSSLLNALIGRDAAIVSDVAGTTRDVVEAHADINGWPVVFADTAGLRATGDAIEAEGMRRARAAAGAADIKIALFDATLDTADAQTLALVDAATVVVANKTDIGFAPALESALLSVAGGVIRISAATGAGLDHLKQALADILSAQVKGRQGPVLTRLRHRAALEETRDALMRCLSAPLPELAAEDMRLALRALGRVTGAVHVEDVLDTIFRDFCIGK